MKRIFTILGLVSMAVVMFGQSPEKMSYQAVVRNAEGGLVQSSNVGIKISILQGSADGTSIYTETHVIATNANGLVTLEIGAGTTNDDFSAISWSTGPYFLKTETDPTGGTNYTIEGVSQILSVPYSLYAKTAGNGFSGSYSDLSNKPAYIDEDKTDDLTLSGNQMIGGNKTFSNTIFANQGLNAGNKLITDVQDPVNNTDAANKAYVDAIKETIYNELLDAGMNGVVNDIDGNSYKTIKIGNQVWMAENLKTTKYKNGSNIAYPGIDVVAWDNNISGAYAWLGNDSIKFKSRFGALYNWYAVNTGNLCPTSWHIPTDTEWTILTDYLGGENVAGRKLKEVGLAWHIDSPFPIPNDTNNATNESGFTALPGGFRNNVYFFSAGSEGIFWSSSESSDTEAWSRGLTYSSDRFGRGPFPKRWGISVRCLKD